MSRAKLAILWLVGQILRRAFPVSVIVVAEHGIAEGWSSSDGAPIDDGLAAADLLLEGHRMLLGAADRALTIYAIEHGVATK